jgi:hypothetical protein
MHEPLVPGLKSLFYSSFSHRISVFVHSILEHNPTYTNHRSRVTAEYSCGSTWLISWDGVLWNLYPVWHWTTILQLNIPNNLYYKLEPFHPDPHISFIFQNFTWRWMMTTLLSLLYEFCDTHELSKSLRNTSQTHKVSKQQWLWVLKCTDNT